MLDIGLSNLHPPETSALPSTAQDTLSTAPRFAGPRARVIDADGTFRGWSFKGKQTPSALAWSPFLHINCRSTGNSTLKMKKLVDLASEDRRDFSMSCAKGRG
jgi:hypothetical protein